MKNRKYEKISIYPVISMIVVIIVMFQFIGCTTELYETIKKIASEDTVPPTVLAISPNNDEIVAAVDINISVTFSESMDPDTITDSTFVLSDGPYRINGQVTYNGSTNTAVFNPSVDLFFCNIYSAQITTEAKDLAGNPLENDYSWSFTTSDVLLVDSDVAESGNGKSWDGAFKTIQEGLAAAKEGYQIWVAEGTYVPGPDNTYTFQLKEGVALYGGFSGSEGSHEDRDWTTHLTVLSGDINGDDIGFTNNAENIDIVVTGANDAVLDGFTITGGNSSEDDVGPFEAAGMINKNTNSPQIVRNCIFEYNAGWNGGAMFNENSSPIVQNCIFNGNTAGQYGAGIFNWNAPSPIITNCTFYGNDAFLSGGGMENWNSSPIVTNCIFWGNNAPSGPEIGDSGTSLITYCLVDGGWDGEGNIEGDPLFIDFANDDYHLQPDSPCIDAGTNGAPSIPEKDFEGDLRIIDGDDNGTATADMGADEALK